MEEVLNKKIDEQILEVLGNSNDIESFLVQLGLCNGCVDDLLRNMAEWSAEMVNTTNTIAEMTAKALLEIKPDATVGDLIKMLSIAAIINQLVRDMNEVNVTPQDAVVLTPDEDNIVVQILVEHEGSVVTSAIKAEPRIIAEIAEIALSTKKAIDQIKQLDFILKTADILSPDQAEFEVQVEPGEVEGGDEDADREGVSED